MQTIGYRKLWVRYALLGAWAMGFSGIYGTNDGAVAQMRRMPVVALHRQSPPATPTLNTTNKKDFDVAPLETRVLGQNTWLRGGPASLRVIVSDHYSGKAANARVTLSLTSMVNGKPSAQHIPLYVGETNAAGTLDAHFTAPRPAAGPYQLTVDVKSHLGEDHIVRPIQLQEAMQLMLTSDKPIYQPGQTIHLRTLALDNSTGAALADQPVTFEVEDARGNKVFKEKKTLSKYGVGSVDFILADEVNMGTFTLRALLPNIPNGETEKKVRVERYVLPKYKIAVTTNKTYYLPGEEVRGTVKATYFFGKPVSDSQVTVTINTVDIGVTKLAELKDKTDPIGVYNFRYTLPKSFVGQPFLQGKAQVEFHAVVKDTADHTQDANVSVPVVKDPVSLVLVPESKTLVPGVENRIYISAATPDGSPLKKTHLFAYRGAPIAGRERDQPGISLTTDDLGLATLAFRANSDEPNGYVWTIEATDAAGKTGVATITLGKASGTDALLLRADRQVAKVGDRLNLIALSTQKGGTVYFDVIRNRQTILTRSQNAKAGEAPLSIPVTHDMVGTLQVRAYKILPDENIIRDTRTIIVSPADDLNVSVTADKSQYRPGGDAVLKFVVRDQQHNPVQTALGLAFVDESVFALSELQPGLERIYFTLEKELMEPRYEIHGLTPTGLLPVRGGRQPMREDVKQRAAALLLAAVPAPKEDEIEVDTFAERWEPIKLKAIQAMMPVCRTIAVAIQKYRTDTKGEITAEQGLPLLVSKGYLTASTIRDPWGHLYRLNMLGAKTYRGYVILDSAGPDGKWGTSDDIKEVSEYGLNRTFLRGGIRFKNERALGVRDDFAFRADAPRALAKGMAIDRRIDGVVAPALATTTRTAGAAVASESAPRVRSYFPETMYWNPSLITDDMGNAQLTVPLADSITTWRLSMFASSRRGQLGSATDTLKVFQDFFVDIDLPVSLTQHDRVEVPVAVYNYLPTPQKVTLTLKEEPWFALQGNATQTITIGANQVSMVSYPIVANAIGKHALEVTAKGSNLSDAMRRQIEITPDGKLLEQTINDRIDGKLESKVAGKVAGKAEGKIEDKIEGKIEDKAEKSISIPANGIEGANSLWVKLYPGTFSQVVEGLDGILRMPNGCFEQTSSTTYPNLLVLDYLKKTRHINPELQMKAEGYINIGYQRLVTFECKNGGFSWFGNEPAHQVLTAYGLLEFSDMARVHEVDPNVIARTQNWLASRQQPDGSWEEKGNGIAEGIINRQTGVLRTSAYIAWALAESGYRGPQLASGVAYVKAHLNEAKDPYTLAVILNLLTRMERDGDTAATVAGRLIDTAKASDKAAFWQSETQTFTGASQHGADLETTGLAAYGLAKWGRNSGFTNKVLTYLVQSKDSFGTWESTQGTVWSMKALLFASENGAGGKGTVNIFANGQKVGAVKITPEDSDVMRQIDLKEQMKVGANSITLEYVGEGSLLYQVVGRCYLPWSETARPQPGFEPMSISVDYDKTQLAQDDTATVTVRVHNNTAQQVEMPLVDVGVPPGFTVNPEQLDEAVKAKTISKYTVAARQIIVYLEKLAPNQTVTLTYQLRAKYPINARTPLSKVYPYYNPEKVTLSQPQNIVVGKTGPK